MTPRETESAILDQLIPQLQAEGYQVFVNPRRELLPQFLQGFQPDAIALGERKNLAIEITSTARGSNDKRRTIERLFEGQSDWELRLIWVSPATATPPVSTQSAKAIAESLSQVRQLVKDEYVAAALLIAWATFEAIARVIQPNTFSRPQTPGRLVEQLAQDGTLTPTEADLLRFLSKKRNGLIHGEVGMAVSPNQVIRFADILDTIIETDSAKNQ